MSIEAMEDGITSQAIVDEGPNVTLGLQSKVFVWVVSNLHTFESDRAACSFCQKHVLSSDIQQIMFFAGFCKQQILLGCFGQCKAKFNVEDPTDFKKVM
jgi:hypothetical protein